MVMQNVVFIVQDDTKSEEIYSLLLSIDKDADGLYNESDELSEIHVELPLCEKEKEPILKKMFKSNIISDTERLVLYHSNINMIIFYFWFY